MPTRSQAQISPEQREQLRAGLSTLQGGDIDGAREIFIDLLEGDPELASGHMGLGRVFAAEGDHVRALEHFQEAAALQPDFVAAQMMAATSHEKMGDIDAAVAALDAAIEANPTKSFTYIRKARLLQGAERPDEARAAIEEGVRRNPQDSMLRTTLANMLGQMGDAEGRLAEYRRAIDLEPENWLPHFSLGAALLREGKYPEARDALTRAADLDPEKGKTHQALGYVLSRMGDHASAALAYEAALVLEPGDTRSILGAAMAKNAIGDHDGALTVLRSAGRRGNRSLPLQRALGDTYLALGQHREAFDTYRALILNNPRLREAAPELVERANAEPGPDPAADAQALKAALAAQSEAQRQERSEGGGGPLAGRNRGPRRGPGGPGGPGGGRGPGGRGGLRPGGGRPGGFGGRGSIAAT
jgi:tetratricopeptide (TPR) repeat protein